MLIIFWGSLSFMEQNSFLDKDTLSKLKKMGIKEEKATTA